MNTKNTLDITEFFSVCQQVVAYAGQIIKEVFETSGGVFKTKLEEEPFTEADVKVQTLIIKTLRTLWPEIKIIGEEEEVFEKKLDFDFNALKTDLISKDLFKDAKGAQIDLTKAMVWVDPLDGTQGFIKGQLDGVTTLIGISVEGESKVGVVGKYFVKDGQGGYRWEPKCYFGHADHPHLYFIDYLDGNKLGEQKPVVRSTSQEELVICTSVHHMTPDLQEKIEKVNPTEKLQIGGAGNKILSIIQGVADCYFYPKPGMKRWDICAGEAILKSVGGIVVGSDNKPITYEEEKGKSVIAEGVIASVSKEKHERVMCNLLK